MLMASGKGHESSKGKSPAAKPPSKRFLLAVSSSDEDAQERCTILARLEALEQEQVLL